jgi:hypothetical protein
MDRWDLRLPDEVRYTEVAREMGVAKSYVLPVLNGQTYSEKPPLFFWLLLLLAKMHGGFSEVTARWISVGAMAGTVLSVYLLGRLLFDWKSGRVAALLLATTAHPFWFSHLGVMDNLLMFFVTVSILAFYAGHRGFCSGRIGYGASALAMGLGVLTKGPLGLLLPWSVLAAWLLWAEGPKGWRRQALWWTPILALIPVLAWLVPACLEGGPEYSRIILWKQNVGRALEGYAHRKPFTFYLDVLPGGLAPWIVMLPLAIWVWLEQRVSKQTDESARWQLPAAWAVVMFLILSFISSKRDKYLLPIYPAASLFVGRAMVLADAERCARIKGWLAKAPVVLFYLALALIGLGAGTLFFLGPGKILDPVLQRLAKSDLETGMLLDFRSRASLGILSLLGVLCAIPGFRRIRRGELLKALSPCLALFLGIALYLNFHIMPALNASFTAEIFCEEMDREVPDLYDARVAVFQMDYSAAFNYCLQRTRIPILQSPQEVTDFLFSKQTSYLIVSEAYLRDLEEALLEGGLRLFRVAQGRVRGRPTFLVTGVHGETMIARPLETRNSGSEVW